RVRMIRSSRFEIGGVRARSGASRKTKELLKLVQGWTRVRGTNAASLWTNVDCELYRLTESLPFDRRSPWSGFAEESSHFRPAIGRSDERLACSVALPVDDYDLQSPSLVHCSLPTQWWQKNRPSGSYFCLICRRRG